MKIRLILLLITGWPFLLNATDYGVWIATAHRIDYPHTKSRAEQIIELKSIVDYAAESGINTLYFQVRGRGDALYQSAYEPWSEVLTGTLGRDPGWDPLDSLIQWSKPHGIKVVAWFNVFKVADQTSAIRSEGQLKHIAEVNPEFILKSGTELFLNPGIPAVRHYLANVAKDLIDNYEIDGLQLDFIRYPTTAYQDQTTVANFKPNGLSVDEWRRQNVTDMVHAFQSVVKSKPTLTLSATPLGIYKVIKGATGLESYHVVYQDSQGWAQSGLVDELVPQVYWTIGNEPEKPGMPASPDYQALTVDWIQKVKPFATIKMGLGIYKPGVMAQIHDQVNYAVEQGADGVVFYSWQYFKASGFKAEKSFKSDLNFTIRKLSPTQVLIENKNPSITKVEFVCLDQNGTPIKRGTLDEGSIHIMQTEDHWSRILFYNQFKEKITDLKL